MSQEESAKQQAHTEAGPDGGCPIGMYCVYCRELCGRPIYRLPNGSKPDEDTEPVCLMHSHHPGKDDGAFQREFERILKEAGEGEADFSSFVFTASDYKRRKFKATCYFNWATFTQKADFSRATFTQDADFSEATFTQGANFDEATFTQDADFNGATFTQAASFTGATFIQAAHFGANFAQGANFNRATFTQGANFDEATFTQGADFYLTTFAQDAGFSHANFTLGANFSGATFTQDADFSEATFTHKADFGWVTFTRAPNFSKATFTQAADFSEAVFQAGVRFSETKFRNDNTLEPGPIFPNAAFKKPEAVIFYKTYLGQALFHNCDVSKFVFRDVRWRKRSNSKSMVFEEEVKLGGEDDWFTEALRPDKGDPDERNYTLIAELYQQLKKNYDDRRDYWTAGDFHYGEMEMKRLHSTRRDPRVRWLHRCAGLAAWYKYASGYGESYVRPFVMLCALILLFALLYPLAGLRWQPGSARAEAGERQRASNFAAKGGASAKSEDAHLPVTYRGFPDYLSRRVSILIRREKSGFGNSLMTTLYVAAFQKDLEYQPSYPWGRLLALVELALTSTLIALFLLAVRRQFRR